MKPFEPPVFPPWTGRVSPLIDARAREIDRRVSRHVEVARKFLWVWFIFIVSGFLWVWIFALVRWAL